MRNLKTSIVDCVCLLPQCRCKPRWTMGRQMWIWYFCRSPLEKERAGSRTEMKSVLVNTTEAHRHSYRFLLAHRRNKYLCRSSLCHRGNGCHCALGLWVCALARVSYLELLGRNRTSHRSLAARVNAGRDSSHCSNLDSLACAGRRAILDRRVDRHNQTHSRDRT